MPDLPSHALAFRVSFESRAAAEAACRQYDGVLADGRVLHVALEAPPAPAAPRTRKEKAQTVTPRLEEEQLPLPVLRQLAQAEAKYLAETERILSRRDAPAMASAIASPSSGGGGSSSTRTCPRNGSRSSSVRSALNAP